MADRQTIDVELDACAGSLTAFTKKNGGKFVIVIVERDGSFHEVSNTTDRQRAIVGEYPQGPMAAPENRLAGVNRA